MVSGRIPRQRVERLVSAGGIVYRVLEDKKIETILCGRIEPARWSLPKGTPDTGESLEETALREVREETGLHPVIQAPLGNINYWFVSSDKRVRFNKTVHFYLMAPTGGCTDEHDPEFDEVRWFPAEVGIKTLTYASEAKLLEKAISMIRDRVAHGSAATDPSAID